LLFDKIEGQLETVSRYNGDFLVEKEKKFLKECSVCFEDVNNGLARLNPSGLLDQLAGE